MSCSGQSQVEIPNNICVNPFENGSNKLIDKVYPYLTNTRDIDLNRSILATKNENVDMINNLVMDKLPATHDQTKTCLTADSVADDDQQGLYPIEFLNTLTPSGKPPHRLYVKKNAPIILLRNLNPKEGLLNGTRLCVVNLGKRIIKARIITGSMEGNTVFLPRITITSIQFWTAV
ncbi:unnamed protein product [Mytilus coruscus]|uniref:DNA helicase Pif1-like 2B domain-containing protein n=1 Tax=Mytilus coruscus TaxID=42192 RepID=A0A6J8DAV4_MYTCO|nr:unnamed protein product [Mytilus coruscus]